MNNKLFLISLLISSSVQIFGQDVVPRQAPIDNNRSSVEDSVNNEQGEKSGFTEIPIIIDSNEGWEWIDNEEAEHVFKEYPIQISYGKYLSHPQYRIIGNEVFDENGKLVRVIRISDCLVRNDMASPITDELLRQTYINDYKNNKYNFKKENQNAQNYVKQELKLITSSRFYWSKEGFKYLRQLELDHRDNFDFLLKFERLNDTSFKLIFGDIQGNSVSTWKIAYLSNGQYKSKIIATRLPLEKIKVRIRVYEFKNGKLTIHED